MSLPLTMSINHRTNVTETEEEMEKEEGRGDS
jgi:hypothetical protein